MIRVVHPGSQILMLTFSHPGSRIQGSKRFPIPDPGSGSATLMAPNCYLHGWCGGFQNGAHMLFTRKQGGEYSNMAPTCWSSGCGREYPTWCPPVGHVDVEGYPIRIVLTCWSHGRCGGYPIWRPTVGHVDLRKGVSNMAPNCWSRGLKEGSIQYGAQLLVTWIERGSFQYGAHLLVTWIEGGSIQYGTHLLVTWNERGSIQYGVHLLVTWRGGVPGNMAPNCWSRGSRGESTQYGANLLVTWIEGGVSNTAPTYRSSGWRLGGFQYGAHLLCRDKDMVENILEDRVGGPEDLEQALSWRPDEEAEAQEAVLPSLLQGQAPRLTAYNGPWQVICLWLDSMNLLVGHPT